MEFDRNKLQTELLKNFEEKPEMSEKPEVNIVHENTKRPEIDINSEPGVPVRILFPLIVIVIIVFGVYAWKTDKFAIDSKDGEKVPVIKADTNDIRSVPADPGGMYIANRDKLIYETISNNDDKKLPKVVKILPEHEEPIARDDIKQGEVDSTEEVVEEVAQKPVKMQELEKVEVQNLSQAEAKVDVSKSEVLEDKKIVKKQELLSNDVAVLKENADGFSNVKEKKVEPPITVADIKNVQVPSPQTRAVSEPKKNNKGAKIQLGAFKSEADVDKNWSSIKKKHDSLLKDLQINVEKADLGDKGVFYRLQVGSIDNESEARKLCQKLIEQNQGCFVVKK